MTDSTDPDEVANRIALLADLIFVACKSESEMPLELCIAAMGFAARALSASDVLQHGGDPQERMDAIKNLFVAAFAHDMQATIAAVETERVMLRMTGRQSD
ncbi:hypothetical protein GCM10025771_33180 [Niveibacterium umoris]|uniref:Uncharacterized protein n=1 Tax=Niveibacterium umoris TaxID=1193620 RepID=A0A840BIS4_9RHOO|nr:hypothetical protein [Niveibacterium umoris]MBB4011489.1 hypothetical protein [Niveibacterium umoris]